jgi:hypothetical protein
MPGCCRLPGCCFADSRDAWLLPAVLLLSPVFFDSYQRRLDQVKIDLIFINARQFLNPPVGFFTPPVEFLDKIGSSSVVSP